MFTCLVKVESPLCLFWDSGKATGKMGEVDTIGLVGAGGRKRIEDQEICTCASKAKEGSV